MYMIVHMSKNFAVIDLCVKFEKVGLKLWRLQKLLGNFGDVTFSFHSVET